MVDNSISLLIDPVGSYISTLGEFLNLSEEELVMCTIELYNHRLGAPGSESPEIRRHILRLVAKSEYMLSHNEAAEFVEEYVLLTAAAKWANEKLAVLVNTEKMRPMKNRLLAIRKENDEFNDAYGRCCRSEGSEADIRWVESELL